MQNDFCLESGSLYVKGATPALWNVEELIYKESFEEVWFTVDWHEPNHISFRDNGGDWPVHCVQYSQGAAINDLLLTACRNNNLRYDVIEKGLFKEEYGAFPDLKPNPNRKSHYTYSLDDIYDSRADIYISNESEIGVKSKILMQYMLLQKALMETLLREEQVGQYKWQLILIKTYLYLTNQGTVGLPMTLNF